MGENGLSLEQVRTAGSRLFAVVGMIILGATWYSDASSPMLLVLLPLLVLQSIPLIATSREARRRRLWHVIVLLAVTIVGLVFGGRLMSGRAAGQLELERLAQDRIGTAHSQLDVVLAALPPVAEKVAARVLGETRNLEQFRARVPEDYTWLEQELEGPGHQPLAQVGFALEPTASADGKRHGPNVVGTSGRSSGVADLLDVLDYDYTLQSEQSIWYQRARLEKKGGWSEPPYFDQDTQAMLAEYTLPLLLLDGSFVGVSYASLPMDSVARFIKGLDLGEGGYAFLVSRTGLLVSYPNQRDVDGKKSLADLAAQEQEPGLTRVSEWVQGTQTSLDPMYIRDPMTGDSAYLLCRRVNGAGWGLCTVTLHSGAVLAVRDSMAMVVAVVTFLFCFLALLLDPGSGSPGRLWALSLSMSVVFVGGIGVIWKNGDNVFRPDGAVIFADSQVIAAVEDNQARMEELGRSERMIEIPSGVLISEVVPGGGSLDLGGMMWQRVSLRALEGEELPPWVGLRLANASSLDQEEVYRQPVNGDMVVGWRFRASVPDLTESNYYPVSRKALRLDLVPPTFADPVLLVPDIGAYDLIVPRSMPGIAPTVSLPGWDRRRAFFSFVEHAWSVDFGLGEAGIARRLSSLRYSATFDLQLINPMVTYLLPESILFVLMFALLCVTSTDPERAARYGLDASTAIGTYATFFFIVVLQHIALRQALASSRLVYLEWVFIVTYLGLLLLTLNALLVAADSRNWIIRFEDNLLSRLAFWPALTGCLFGITVVEFSL